MGIHLKVCGLRGEMKIIDLCNTWEQFRSITVLQLKEKIIEEFRYQGQPSELCLIFCDKTLEEPRLLSEYGISHIGKSVEIDLCDTEEQLRSIRVLQLEEKILERRDDLGLTDSWMETLCCQTVESNTSGILETESRNQSWWKG